MSQPTQKKLIQKTPGVCGGNPRIRDTRIAVWTLVSFRQQGVLDEEASHYLVEFADTQGREYSIATLFLSLIA